MKALLKLIPSRCRPTPSVSASTATRTLQLPYCLAMDLPFHLMLHQQELLRGHYYTVHKFPFTAAVCEALAERIRSQIPRLKQTECCTHSCQLIPIVLLESERYQLRQWLSYMDEWLAELLQKIDANTIGGYIDAAKITRLYEKLTDIRRRLISP